MPFVLRPDRRLPEQCSVTHSAGPFQGQGTVLNLSCAGCVSLGICRCGPPCAFLSPFLEHAALRAFAVHWKDFEPLKEVLLCGSA